MDFLWPVTMGLPTAAIENIIFVVTILTGMVKLKYFGLWCDCHAWDLMKKRQKTEVNSVTSG